MLFESQDPSNNKQEVMLSPVVKPNFGIYMCVYMYVCNVMKCNEM